MKQLNYSFTLSDEAFELLKTIHKEGYAEYRDAEFETLADFLASDEHKDGLRTIEWFLNRNANGTYYLIPDLLKHNLIESDGMSWHITYCLTDLGKEVLRQNS